MKKMPWNARHSLPLIYAALGMIMAPFASSQDVKYQPMVFDGPPVTVDKTFRLPSGCFSGAGTVTISPARGERCSLEIAESSVIESAKFVVEEGGQLRIRGATLRGCHIWAEPGAEVIIEASALDRCEFGGSKLKTKTQTSFRVTNCVIQGGAWLAPANAIGLEMLDCIVRDQLSNSHVLRVAMGGESTPLSNARRPSVRYTKFENCLLHPTLLVTISQVTIERCRSMFDGSTTLFGSGANAAPEVVLPIRWVNSVPEVPPTVGGGVAVQRLAEPISGGCSLTAKAEEGKLSLDGLVNSAPEPLHAALPAATKGPMAAGGLVAPDGTSTDEFIDPLIKLKQAHVNGLLVMSLDGGKEVGQVTKMNVTTLPGRSVIRFSQYVGEDMATALREVQKFMQVRHAKMPSYTGMEIAFEEKYSEKDGPSGAVACALLIESVLTGKTWDPTFAVTGDMNADGAIQPIGGVAAKMRGATKGACKIVAFPTKNENAISDILVLDGPGPFVAIHAFALNHFDQAATLAHPGSRPEVLQQALAEFEVIQSVLQRDPRQMQAILRSPQAVARLQAIAEKAPHSLSAKYLLLYAQGRQATVLSMGGSLETADANALGLVSSIQNDFKGTVSSLKQDELGGTLNRLRNLRPRMDKRVWGYVDALVDYGEIVRSEVVNPARTYTKFNEMAGRARAAASIAVSAKKSLLADPQVREDLGL